MNQLDIALRSVRCSVAAAAAAVTIAAASAQHIIRACLRRDNIYTRDLSLKRLAIQPMTPAIFILLFFLLIRSKPFITVKCFIIPFSSLQYPLYIAVYRYFFVLRINIFSIMISFLLINECIC